MDKKSCIDIVLPSCNGAGFIREQIQSVQANRGYPELVRNFIIVDDASDDRTVAILNEFAQEDSGIRIITHAGARRGVKQNVAFGLGQTSAPFVMLCDQDDVWHADKLHTMVNAMQDAFDTYGPDTPLLGFSDLEVVDEDLNTLDSSFWHYQKLNPQGAQIFRRLLCQNVAPGCSMILNRILLNRALPFPARAIMHDWWLVLVACGLGRVFYSKRALLKYRQHPHNQIGAQRFRDIVKKGLPQALERAQTHLHMISAQAQAYYAVFGADHLSIKDKRSLLALKDLYSRPAWIRQLLVLKGALRKSGFLRNAAMFIAAGLPE